MPAEFEEALEGSMDLDEKIAKQESLNPLHQVLRHV